MAAEPLLTVSADGPGNADPTAVYGEEFARSFAGGLNAAQADLDGDGYPELITATAIAPRVIGRTCGEASPTRPHCRQQQSRNGEIP